MANQGTYPRSNILYDSSSLLLVKDTIQNIKGNKMLDFDDKESINHIDYTIPVELDSHGDAFITLPDDVIKATGLTVGDDVDWSDNGDGTWTLTKREVPEVPEVPEVNQAPEREYVLIETLLTYRLRYVVEVPVGQDEHIIPSLELSELKEFSQRPLEEQISSYRTISNENVISLCDGDNGPYFDWTDEKKLEIFTNSWEELDA